MNNKTIFLDHFALVRVTSDQLFTAIVKEFVTSNEYTLIIGVMNLIELYRWKKRSIKFHHKEDHMRVASNVGGTFTAPVYLASNCFGTVE